MMRYSVTIILLLALVGLLLPAPARADAVLTYTAVQHGGTPDAGTFSLPKFNPTLGLLQSVRLDLTGDSNGGGFYCQNMSSVAIEANFSMYANIKVASPDPATLLLVMVSMADYEDRAIPGYGTVSSSWPFLSASNSMAAYSPDGGGSADLSYFIGSGNISWSWSADSGSRQHATGSSTDSYTNAPNFDFTAAVTYTYGPRAPEPASLGLLSLGALAMMKRRRE